ncbi:hypothetical protein [Actinacidiphila epipremni]|uniref:Uncharacterized protein n=1 Tax=Actinacidiphila epipremni TaxID=2053013 RepID=A0ABX0ZU83_9ACTN|nr:hypothetical protein [Actinacidiphila epipremni]NJP46791.1 hypothetical protein [Actinacidiphila epipremni]
MRALRATYDGAAGTSAVRRVVAGPFFLAAPVPAMACSSLTVPLLIAVPVLPRLDEPTGAGQAACDEVGVLLPGGGA